MQISYWASTTQPYAAIRDAGRWAAEAGWCGMWVPDHFMSAADGDNGPGPTDAEMDPMLEGWVTLGALAASVPDIRLGLMVGGNTYRHPAVVANMALTLDHISGGRAVLGLGAGWQTNDHERLGIELPSRKVRSDMLEEAAALCRAVFAAGGGRVDFSGEHYTLTQMPVHPAPVNGSIPIMIGGAGATRTLRTVARSADEWNAWGRPETIAGHLDVLRDHCEAEGRDLSEIRITAVGLLIITDDTETGDKLRAGLAHRSGLVGTIDELKAVVEAYREVGVDELIVPDFTILGEHKIDTLERLQNEVLA